MASPGKFKLKKKRGNIAKLAEEAYYAVHA